MIISDRHKYLFLEMPYSASTATSKELIEHYNGRLVFNERHAPYAQFLQIATPEQRKYFVFAGIRNPLDTIVTTYLKSVRKGLLPKSTDFSTYFTNTYSLPYVNFVSMSARYVDFFIRFESLQTDIEECLKKMGVEQIQPLPSRNRTSEKSKHFLEYYTPDIIPRVQRVLGPYMAEWGYSFPSEWPDHNVSKISTSLYALTKILKINWWAIRWRFQTTKPLA
jgi:hypothetical protein